MEAVPQPADPVRSAHARRNPSTMEQGRCHGERKLALQESHSPTCGTKLALLAQNGPIWQFLPVQGELYTAVTSNKPSRANFLPHQPQHHHGLDRNDTPSGAMKHFPPQLHTPHRSMKHLSPQRATNDPKSPISPTQGRTFFHNTHHPHNTHPRLGDFSFNPQGKSKRTNSRMQFPSVPSRHNLIIHKIPTIRLHTMKHT